MCFFISLYNSLLSVNFPKSSTLHSCLLVIAINSSTPILDIFALLNLCCSNSIVIILRSLFTFSLPNISLMISKFSIFILDIINSSLGLFTNSSSDSFLNVSKLGSFVTSSNLLLSLSSAIAVSFSVTSINTT